MIDFKQRSEVLPSALILFSIVILALTLAYMVFVPAPSVKGLVKGRAMSRQRIQDQIGTTKTRVAQTQKAIRTRLWTGNPDTVSAAVLAQLTASTQTHAIALGAFRPQRTIELAGVTELPYIVQMTGSYNGVFSVLQSLTAPNSKVVLRSVQIASSQTTDSAVTATLGLSTYLPSDPAIVAAPLQGGQHGKHV